MKKRLLVGLAAGVCCFGIVDMVQAGSDSHQDFFIEGPSYKFEETKAPIAAAKVECIDGETFFTEGIRSSKCIKGQMISSKACLFAGNCSTEGAGQYSRAEISALKEQALSAMPAAGSHLR